jgi:uncharacterized protein YbjT (DUF2867 family)
MTILIHGATGAQGAPVLGAVALSDEAVQAAVRDASAYIGPGVAVAVEYTSVDSLEKAYEGADAIFVHLPVGPAEMQLAHATAVVEAIRRARPARVVMSTSGFSIDVPGNEGSPMDALARGIRETGVSLAIVAPRLFLENLLLPTVLGPAREGVLAYPIRDDYAVSWSSHLDVADVAARLLRDTSVTGVVGVGALPGLLGTDLAAGFAEHLGRDVRFEAQTPDEFGVGIVPLFGEAGAAPVVDSYRWRGAQPSELIEDFNSAQTRLGMTPRTVTEWLRDLGV